MTLDELKRLNDLKLAFALLVTCEINQATYDAFAAWYNQQKRAKEVRQER